MAEGDACVIFDGQCPFCRAYVASLEDKNDINKNGIRKVDARCAPEVIAQLASKGVNINAGIVLIKGGAVFQDAEALTLLSKQHAASGWFGSLHHRLLRYRFLSLAIYPILRALRNAYLRLAGQSAIETGIDKG
ncbi:MAG: DCC1-like thiol-disulfide oxidoreductase family protein [Candidatus Reddybacter sp.]